MPQHQLVISVMGGLVENVYTDAPDLEVILCDFDVTDGEKDHPHYVEFKCVGLIQRAVVAPLNTAALPDTSQSIVGMALHEAGLAWEPNSLVRVSRRELATLLAALRCFQKSDHEASEILSGMEHFGEHQPLSLAEIDDLCERLNWVEESPPACECEQPGYFTSGVPGILAHAENGRVAPDAEVERCDLCDRYPNDLAARAELVRRGLAAPAS